MAAATAEISTFGANCPFPRPGNNCRRENKKKGRGSGSVSSGNTGWRTGMRPSSSFECLVLMVCDYATWEYTGSAINVPAGACYDQWMHGYQDEAGAVAGDNFGTKTSASLCVRFNKNANGVCFGKRQEHIDSAVGIILPGVLHPGPQATDPRWDHCNMNLDHSCHLGGFKCKECGTDSICVYESKMHVSGPALCQPPYDGADPDLETCGGSTTTETAPTETAPTETEEETTTPTETSTETSTEEQTTEEHTELYAHPWSKMASCGDYSCLDGTLEIPTECGERADVPCYASMRGPENTEEASMTCGAVYALTIIGYTHTVYVQIIDFSDDPREGEFHLNPHGFHWICPNSCKNEVANRTWCQSTCEGDDVLVEDYCECVVCPEHDTSADIDDVCTEDAICTGCLGDCVQLPGQAKAEPVALSMAVYDSAIPLPPTASSAFAPACAAAAAALLV